MGCLQTLMSADYEFVVKSLEFMYLAESRLKQYNFRTSFDKDEIGYVKVFQDADYESMNGSLKIFIHPEDPFRSSEQETRI